jgi:AcrR family transcriptional regulator
MKDTRQWILEAAVQLFTKNGYTRTTTRAIAELAGIHESTFFRTYKNKSALLSELLYIMTPGPEEIDSVELTDGEDVQKDFEVFLYYNAMLHVRHIPVFRLAMHVDKVYDQPRFAKIKALVSYTAEYFQYLNQKGDLVDFDYLALAEHINSLTLTKASEFIAGENFGIPAERSARNFALQYATYFNKMFSAVNQL